MNNPSFPRRERPLQSGASASCATSRAEKLDKLLDRSSEERVKSFASLKIRLLTQLAEPLRQGLYAARCVEYLTSACFLQ